MKKYFAFYLLLLFTFSLIRAQEPEKSSGVKTFSIKKKTEEVKPEPAKETPKEKKNKDGEVKEKSAKGTFEITKAKDEIPPVISIIAPDVKRGFKPVTEEKTITVTGKVTDQSGIFEVKVNNVEADVSAEGLFKAVVPLAFGDNSITVKAVDIAMNMATEKFQIERKDKEVEVIPAEPAGPVVNVVGKYYALIIGNNIYEDPAISSLENAISDATKLYDVLTTDYAFEKENVIFLKNATQEQIIEAFDNLSNKITPNDNLLVFYAGHGKWDEIKSLGYWLPVDAKKSNTARWIPNSRIGDYMRSINSKHTLLIADACFSGSIFKTRKAFNDAAPSINKLYELSSRKAMTSGNLKEVPDKSVFLSLLVKRLTDNTEKYISSDVLFSSFRQSVLNNSDTEPLYGTIQNAGDDGGEFIFIKRGK